MKEYYTENCFVDNDRTLANYPNEITIRGSISQEMEQIDEWEQDSIICNYLKFFLSFYVGISGMRIENDTPLLLGSFTNLTSIGFLKTNSSSNPLIVDPFTYPRASKLVRERASVIGAKGEQLPLPNSSVSSIQSESLISYILTYHQANVEKNIRSIVSEMFRVLKPGGRVVLVDTIDAYRELLPNLHRSGFRVFADKKGNPVFSSIFSSLKSASAALEDIELLTKDNNAFFRKHDNFKTNLNRVIIIAEKPV